ncbi:hypothetical protein [Halorussus amylolyticus]|uniref:hypothetical protein n=1 Tax=Halorussus amylolyticus TaxID=1126242 RepID=UPI0010506BAE|nr:hypothetical protein [Halorussus amylolyticus]
MARDAEGKLLRFRTPVSETFFRDYGVPLAFTAGGLLVVALVLADGVVEAATFIGAFVGLSLGSILAGLAVYNVVVVVLLAASR